MNVDKLLICGGRHFTDYLKLEAAMRSLSFTPAIIIEGGCGGADILAKQWAINNDVQYAEVPAMWDNFGKRAGPLRNYAMYLLNPEYCLAMPGDKGTQDMVNLCTTNNIPVWRPYG